MVFSFVLNDGKVLADLKSFGNELQIAAGRYAELLRLASTRRIEQWIRHETRIGMRSIIRLHSQRAPEKVETIPTFSRRKISLRKFDQSGEQSKARDLLTVLACEFIFLAFRTCLGRTKIYPISSYTYTESWI